MNSSFNLPNNSLFIRESSKKFNLPILNFINKEKITNEKQVVEIKQNLLKFMNFFRT